MLLRALTWTTRLTGLLSLAAYFFLDVSNPALLIFGSGMACFPALQTAERESPSRQPLRFYRDMNGKIHFYRKVDPVRLEQLEHELGIGIVEPEPTPPPAPAKVLTSSGYRSVDQAMKSIASVYLVPPPMMARRQARRLARNYSCAECNGYVEQHYSDSNPPPLPVLTEPQDTL